MTPNPIFARTPAQLPMVHGTEGPTPSPLLACTQWSTVAQMLAHVFHDFCDPRVRRYMLATDAREDARVLSSPSAYTRSLTFSAVVRASPLHAQPSPSMLLNTLRAPGAPHRRPAPRHAASALECFAANIESVLVPSKPICTPVGEMGLGICLENTAGGSTATPIISRPRRFAHFVVNNSTGSSIRLYAPSAVQSLVEITYMSVVAEPGGCGVSAALWFDAELFRGAFYAPAASPAPPDIGLLERALRRTLVGVFHSPVPMQFAPVYVQRFPNRITALFRDFQQSVVISNFRSGKLIDAMPVNFFGTKSLNVPTDAAQAIIRWGIHDRFSLLNVSPLLLVSPPPISFFDAVHVHPVVLEGGSLREVAAEIDGIIESDAVSVSEASTCVREEHGPFPYYAAAGSSSMALPPPVAAACVASPSSTSTGERVLRREPVRIAPAPLGDVQPSELNAQQLADELEQARKNKRDLHRKILRRESAMRSNSRRRARMRRNGHET